MPSARPGQPCELLINPDTSYLRYFSIKGLRMEPWTCGVCKTKNAAEHQASEWCAGYLTVRKPGRLFDAVRTYLEHLKSINELRDDMSDDARIDAVYVLYVYLTWETNKMGSTKRGSEAVGGKQRRPDSLTKPGTWRSVIVEEGRAIGVPEEVFNDYGVHRAYGALTTATRNTKRTPLLQVRCSTNQSAFQHHKPNCTHLLPPPTIAPQKEVYDLFKDLRTAIDAHLTSEKLTSVKATVDAVVARQQQLEQRQEQQEQRQERQEQRIDQHDTRLDQLQLQVQGLQQWKNEQDEEQEQEKVVQERLELDADLAGQRRESVLALGTGAALARSGSANTQPAAAMGPAAEPASSASPTSSTSGATEILTPTITPPPKSETGELDQQALSPGPVGVPAPAPSAFGLPQLQMQDDQVKQARSKMKDSTNSPVRPAAAGSSSPCLCTSTQHVEKSYLSECAAARHAREKV